MATLARLADFENAQRGYAFPTVETLARETGQSKRATETNLALLEEFGALSREKFTASVGAQHLRSRYVLHVPEIYRAEDAEWQRWNKK
ncbi:helix-turn-helix domain-containing protein [Cryobacterium sp. TMT4-31]|uniref:helix-turn-helix domain-containing protein n=1 Tax=Cryobacterium sp. TMT4-31 TaxID=1259259 RepID=UPI00141B749D|nr:helix-turn-helix domain-containing protein [Cryobacterium sp. TMT4-31]